VESSFPREFAANPIGAALATGGPPIRNPNREGLLLHPIFPV
jgi:hypothetical protein